MRDLGNSIIDQSHDEQPPQDACGVFGVWAPGEDVARLAYFGLFALQHRGSQSAGIAVSNGGRIMVVKDMGLVSQVFDEPALNSLRGHLAVGHCQYSSMNECDWINAQPTLSTTADGRALVLGHNGCLTNTEELRDWLFDENAGHEVPQKGRLESSSDTALISALIGAHAEKGVLSAAQTVLPQLNGAFCLVFSTEETLYAARDPHGVHPLVLGRLNSGWVVASETSALDIVGATFVREIEPGELITIDESGVRTYRFAEANPHGCIFEYVYLARPDTVVSGQRIQRVRTEIGRTLALEAPAEADLVIPTPDSGTPAAIGYARASGIPYGHGLVKNAYVGRTFIQPSQSLRQLGIRLKLNPIRDVIEGQRLVVVDDSIVRGNTQRALVAMLRQAGAAEVHIRIASPTVEWPCYYGIDFATRAELIAPSMSVDEICHSIGADSLAFVSLAGLVTAIGVEKQKLCRACFDGEYPIALPPGCLTALGMGHSAVGDPTVG